jgi:hypothetical protein
MMNQIELRRQAIADRFAHAWNKSSTRIPIQLKEYRALLDLWEKAYSLSECLKMGITIEHIHPQVIEALEKLEKGG